MRYLIALVAVLLTTGPAWADTWDMSWTTDSTVVFGVDLGTPSAHFVTEPIQTTGTSTALIGPGLTGNSLILSFSLPAPARSLLPGSPLVGVGLGAIDLSSNPPLVVVDAPVFLPEPPPGGAIVRTPTLPFPGWSLGEARGTYSWTGPVDDPLTFTIDARSPGSGPATPLEFTAFGTRVIGGTTQAAEPWSFIFVLGGFAAVVAARRLTMRT